MYREIDDLIAVSSSTARSHLQDLPLPEVERLADLFRRYTSANPAEGRLAYARMHLAEAFNTVLRAKGGDHDRTVRVPAPPLPPDIDMVADQPPPVPPSPAPGHEWYYTNAAGERAGPVTVEAMQDMIARQAFQGSELVWTPSFGPEWKRLSVTPLWVDMGKMPALPVETINSTPIWILAVCPLLFAIGQVAVRLWLLDAGYAIYAMGPEFLWVTIFVCAAINTILATLDTNAIKKTGNAAPHLMWAFFLIPVYIWQRNAVLRVSQAPFIVWMVLFVVSLLF